MGGQDIRLLASPVVADHFVAACSNEIASERTVLSCAQGRGRHSPGRRACDSRSILRSRFHVPSGNYPTDVETEDAISPLSLTTAEGKCLVNVWACQENGGSMIYSQEAIGLVRTDTEGLWTVLK